MNPYRFREMSAQEVIDCDIADCFTAERKVNDALERYER